MKLFYRNAIFALLLLLMQSGVALGQVLIPATGSNTVLCGTNVTLCDAAGCATNYTANNDGFTVLRATGTAAITISGTVNTEVDADLIIVYDGIGTAGTIVFQGSGALGAITPIVGAPGQSLTVRFISDGSTQAAGVNLSVSYSGVCGTETAVPISGNQTYPCGTNHILTDHAGPAANYSNNANGFVVFQNAGAATIGITGPYNTEAGADFIRIYAGSGVGGTLLAQVSGAGSLSFFSSPGQTVTLQFVSNGATVSSGFDLSVSYSGPCVCPTFTATATPAVGCSPVTSQLFVDNVPANAYTVSTIPFAPFSCAGGTAGPTGDDAATAPITLPFPFTFYGTQYTQLGISTNGNIQFGAGPYNASYTSVGPIPATNIDNMIALNYADWMANNGGTITYQTQGTAPNRRFIVCFNSLVPFGFGPPLNITGSLTGQIVLYEGSNIVEMHITNNTLPGNNTQTQGLQASNGVGVGVGGRNYADWTATNSGVRFNPNVVYNWAPSAPLNNATIQDPIASNLTSTTLFTVTTTYAGCTNVSNVTVTVNPMPTVTVSPSTTTACAGQATTLTASGASSYLWSTGATTAAITISPASSTNYTVTGTAPGGCTISSSAAVNIAPSITVSNYSICQGAAVPAGQGLGATIAAPSAAVTTLNGSTVGQPTYNRVTTLGPCALSAVGTAVNYHVTTFTPTFTGTYSVQSCGSGNWDMFTTIYQNSFNPASPCTNPVAVGDDGGPGGGATGCNNGNVIAVPMTAGVTYFIVNTSFSNGVTGAYTVTITPPAPPAPTLAWFNVPTGGTSLGSTSPFNPVGVAGSGLNNTNTPGMYTFYAEANGCRAPVTFTVNAAPAVTITGATAVCPSQPATLTASGAASYNWNTGATTAAITVSPAATTTYTVTGTNASGCTATQTATITVSNTATTTITGTLAICSGGSTTLTAAVASSYLWNTGATTAAITVSPATNTTYSVTTTLASGCTATTSSTVTVNPLPSPIISGTNSICVGASTTLTASGGATYRWNTGATTAAITVSPVANTTYTVTATSAAGCSATVSSTVTVNPLPTPAIAGTTTICAGRSTTLTASGGNTYLWNTGATTAAITVSPAANTTYTVTATSASGCTATVSSTVTVNPLPTPAISGTFSICPGNSTTLTASGGSTYSWNTGATTAAITVSPAGNTTYSVTATSAAGCTASTSATVTVTATPTTTITGNLSICNGTSTTLTAGTGVSYAWNTGATAAAITVSPAANTPYSVTVTLAGGCTATFSSTVTVNPLPSATIAGTNVICAGNSTTLTAAGGNTYLWNTGATTAAITVSPAANTAYTVTATSAAGCTATASSTVTVNPLPSPAISGALAICLGASTTLTASGANTYLWNTGATTAAITVSPAVNTAYSATATSAAGCTATTSSTVTINAAPTPAIAGTNAICAGTSTTLTASGANTYLWNTGATTAAITVSPAANTTYTITATSAAGCTATTSSTVTVNPLPTPSISGTTAICAGASTTLTAAGGNTYLWNTGATTAAITVSPAVNTTYTVTATSAAGCTATTSSTVTVNPLPTPSISGTTTICAGASTTLTAAGGNTYLWNTGETTATISPAPAATTAYTVTATSSAGCIATAQTTVTVGSNLSITLAAVNISCNGGSNGSITSSIAGGSAAFSYNWSNGATTANISGLGLGTYTLTATDGICTATQTATITQPSALSLSVASFANAGCGAGANAGSISVTTGGGSTPYGFRWSNNATTQNIANLTVGTYMLTLTDANGCTATASQQITNGGIVVGIASAIDTVCFGASTGAATASAIPAAGASFLWSNGATSTAINNLAAGVYTVSATNVNAGVTCTDVISVTVHQPSADLAASVSLVQPLDCSGNDVAELTSTPTGGWGGYTYQWSNSGNSSNIAGLAAGNYAVTVTDAQGCQTFAAGTVDPILIPQVDAWIGAVGANSATVDAGVSIDVNAGTNQAGVSYVWTPTTGLADANVAATTLTLNEAGTFVYTVVATAGNCSATGSVEITVRATFLGMPTAFTPNGDGDNDFFRPAQLNAQYIKSFRVFNRWGQMIYDDAALTNGGWDGTYKGADQPRDAYIYVLEYQLPQDSEPTKMRGEFTLIR